MIKKKEIGIGKVNREQFIKSLSKIVAKKSGWNYGVFRKTDLGYHGKVDELEFNIIPLTYGGPIAYFKGKYLSDEDENIINKVSIKSIIPFWWLIIYSILSIMCSGIPLIILGGNFFYLKFGIIFLSVFTLAMIYHTWLIRYELNDLKRELIIIARRFQIEEK